MQRIIDLIEEALPVIPTCIMFLAITVQVFFRYVLSNALDWPEEVARYAFIVLVYFGAGLVSKYDSHLEVSIAKHSFGATVGRWITLFSALCTIVYCGIIFVWGIHMVLFVRESQQYAAAIPVPMYVFYMVIPSGMLWMLLRTITSAWRGRAASGVPLQPQ